MDVVVGDRFETFVKKIVKEGRYASASEVVCEGLRLLKERDAKIAALRREISAAIEEGGEVTPEELDAALDAVTEELKRQGY